MNWDAVSAIAEVVGLIVVVASLIYLAAQIRQNTNAIQSGTREAFLNALQTCNSFALENSDVWHRGMFQGEDLEGEELTRFVTIVHAALNAYEALYSEYLAGNVEEAFWESKVRQISWVFRHPSSQHAWYEYTNLFDERFVQYVNQNIDPAQEST
jgi:hypothetical protein